MTVAWGITVTALSLFAWGGQAVAWFSPVAAVKWKLLEAEEDVEPMFWTDARAEALWDTFTLWTMVVAGVLMVAKSSAWAYFGLVGGGMYVYFGGRGIFARVAMGRKGLRIGAPPDVRIGITFCGIWAVMALITIVAAIRSLAG